jgi:hypothetical protein
MTMATTTRNIIDIYTAETVGTIEMDDFAWADYCEDCGDVGAICAAQVCRYGSVDWSADVFGDRTVFVEA